MRRSRVVVEHRNTALEEAGDLILAIDEGDLEAARIGELVDLLGGDGPSRRPEEITVFKSVGLAFQDLAVARLALRNTASHAIA